MDPIVDFLGDHGFHTLRVSFHRDRNLKPAALASCWLSEIADGYRELKARHPTLPVYNLSHSMGAVVTVRFLELEQAALFERMVLLSPAIALTRGAALVRYLRPLRFLGVSLPSATPRSLRARDATPIAEYATMLDLIDDARTIASPWIGSIPTAVLASPRDELVSYEGLDSWMRRNNLENWSLKPVQAEAHRISSRHLAVLESVRQRGSIIQREILSHFTGEAGQR